jgi:hypothetical protein
MLSAQSKGAGMRGLVAVLSILVPCQVFAAGDAWYSQGNFEPVQRLEFRIANTLGFDRANAPVVIRREDFPQPDVHEMWVTVVDPALPPYEGPSEQLLRLQGGHQLRAEINGHAVFHQLDDLDRDGIWDELFFQTDIAANAGKTVYVYLGENTRGWNRHSTHANIGSYARHLMPFWESEHVGWKIWFANAVDVYAKREPVLMANRLYMENLDGYGVSAVDPALGSDIQRVADSFGGGAICLFEDPQAPSAVSLPRYTPARQKLAPESSWNAGQLSDTRYTYEVVANGPVRSIIRIRGLNWDSGHGYYEYEQTYTAFARQSYTASRVVFTKFLPRRPGVRMGVGFRKKPEENHFVQEGGLIISSGPEEIRDPENIDDREAQRVEFIGSALIVKDRYAPAYRFVEDHRGNHAFSINAPDGNSFEFMLASAWSEGAVYNNAEAFTEYIRKTRQEYNHPLDIRFAGQQEKEP